MSIRIALTVSRRLCIDPARRGILREAKIRIHVSA
jgi:hypothetical protein